MTDLPRGYRWAHESELTRPDAIVIPRTKDSDGNPYTRSEADIAVPIYPGRKALVEMMAANIHGSDHDVDLTMQDAAALATNLAPMVERIIEARVRRAVSAARKEMEGGYAG